MICQFVQLANYNIHENFATHCNIADFRNNIDINFIRCDSSNMV